MNNEEILSVFRNLGAVITDSHLVYTSGKHGNAYINKDELYRQPHVISSLCAEIAYRLKISGFASNCDVLAIAAPALGGIVLSQWVAYYYGSNILALFAERASDESFVFKRGQEKVIAKSGGKTIVVVEDILNTGASARKTVDAVRKAGGDVKVVAALCNRGCVTAEMLGVEHLISLIDFTLDAWEESECPLCKAGVPINTNVGHGMAFLARQAAESPA